MVSAIYIYSIHLHHIKVTEVLNSIGNSSPYYMITCKVIAMKYIYIYDGHIRLRHSGHELQQLYPADHRNLGSSGRLLVGGPPEGHQRIIRMRYDRCTREQRALPQHPIISQVSQYWSVLARAHRILHT